MRSMIKLMAAVTVLTVLGAAALPAATITFTSQSIAATANIFGAGNGTTPNPGGGGGGTVAPVFDFSSVPLPNLLQFTSVTGLVNCCGGAAPQDTGADGGQPLVTLPPGFPTLVDTNIPSVGSISGIQFTQRQMFLVGVFLGPGVPAGAAPATLSYTALSSQGNQFSPLLNQVFFIGDGLTGTGTGAIQDFFVPVGATRLFLGFADAAGFINPAGHYEDNSGSLTASFLITGAPEPGTMLLMGLGLAGIAVRRFRR